jgi:mono/diheme cytochrome c family protein
MRLGFTPGIICATCATEQRTNNWVHNKYMRSELILVAGLVSAMALAGCQSTPAPKPLDQLTEKEAHGHEVFQARCSVCHFDRSSQKRQGPPLRGLFKKQYLPSGAPANDDRVSATVLHGRTMMPGQPDIDPQDLDDLLAYLHTL